MADVVVSLRIMPKSPSINLEQVQEKATQKIKEFGGEVGKADIEPVAFGLKALILVFVMNESLGGTDSLEEAVQKISGVQSAEVTDVRRAIG
jgi:elongation factor 1-beta